MNKKFVVGLDYGSDSVRAVVVDADSGEEVSSAVHNYSRWSEGKYCDPAANQFRQHPLDYLEGLEIVMRESLAAAPEGTAAKVCGIGVDTTGSTPIAVDENGVALSLKDEFKDNPNAMFVLWKDHTGIKESDEINELAKNWGGEDYTKYCGGIYSSEWFWAKLLHVSRVDSAVRAAAFSWVEHCDWLPGVLTGNINPLTMKRSRCAAGHKAMWHESFGGLPSEEFLTRLDPMLSGIRSRLYSETFTAEVPVGNLTSEWAAKLGLPEGVVVSGGAFDAHMGAVGGGIKPGSLLKVMGTSTCDMLIAPMDQVGDKLIKGICGQVDGSIVPGMLGMEAGQSAFGDLYAWFRELLLWPLRELTSDLDAPIDDAVVSEIASKVLPKLEEKALEMEIGESGVLALDWINGRRTPDADQSLKCAITGMSMGSDPVAIYRALVEATAFGSKSIVDRFAEEGVEINEVIALGGVAKKSNLVMRIVSDVLGLEIKVVESEQACALGAAMFAAVAAGLYGDVRAAQDSMGCGISASYVPNPENTAKFAELYAQYRDLGHFVEEKSMFASSITNARTKFSECPISENDIESEIKESRKGRNI